MFLQSSKWKWKETSTRDFFKLSKKNLLHGCFHIFQFSRSVPLRHKWFYGWEQREENINITRNASRSDVLTLLTLPSANVKSTVLLRVPSLIKVEELNLRNSCSYIFTDGSVGSWLWFDSWATFKCQWSYINANVSVSLIFNNTHFYLKYYFLHHGHSFLEEIQQSVNCYVSSLTYSSLYL